MKQTNQNKQNKYNSAGLCMECVFCILLLLLYTFIMGVCFDAIWLNKNNNLSEQVAGYWLLCADADKVQNHSTVFDSSLSTTDQADLSIYYRIFS